MIEVEVEDAAWIEALPEVEALALKAAERTLSPALAGDGRDERGGVTILLTGDAEVQDLNARFRGQDKPTNVLSFPAAPHPGEPGAAPHLGDLALACGVCAREAEAQGKALAHHLQHLVVHGVLHLLGLDHLDDAEAEAMEARERDILSSLGLPDPYAAAGAVTGSAST